jgi:hypothetical protein
MQKLFPPAGRKGGLGRITAMRKFSSGVIGKIGSIQVIRK